MLKRIPLSAAVLILAAGLAGCGEEGGGPPAVSTATPSASDAPKTAPTPPRLNTKAKPAPNDF